MPAALTCELPDLFRFDDGRPVLHTSDWRPRREEIAAAVVPLQYGSMPPAPRETIATQLHRSRLRHFLDAELRQYRVSLAEAPGFGFRLDVFVPARRSSIADAGPLPVVLTGDACWRYVTDEITLDVLQLGYILAQFSRVEIVPDNGNWSRDTGLYNVFPEGDFGAIAAWAWGYHRCIDVLRGLDEVDAGRIAVVGHSRGGKASLLAGATDERIALTSANNSGCGGAGCYRYQGPNSETLATITKAFPGWFSPRLKEYAGREKTLPFDQHSLKALVAPRLLLCTEALGDLWANPSGTWLTHLAAREAYCFLGAKHHLAIHYREGIHDHTTADWQIFLDFADAHFAGRALLPSHREPERHTFPDLSPLHTWRAPC